jgi:hypothetical protein
MGWTASPGRRAWLWVLTLLLLAVLVWVLGHGTTERPVRPEIGVTGASGMVDQSAARARRGVEGGASQAATTPAPDAAAPGSSETPARD